MIGLTRARTTQGIPAGFRGQGRLEQALALLDLRLQGAEPQPSVWKAAKPRLRAETDGKCAYCEGKAAHVAHGDVEHFRPKSEYWWLAYCYDNFLYSCQICNQSYKGANFPRAGARLREPPTVGVTTDAQRSALARTFGVDPLDTPALELFDAARRKERASIPDPYQGNPERVFRWFADDTLREVEARPRNAQAQRRFDAADRFLGLNRDELKRWRYTTYERAMFIADVVEEGAVSAPLLARARDQLRQMTSVTGEFAGMVRYFIRDVRGIDL